MLGRGFISKQDLKFFKIVDRIEDAVEEIKSFYRNYHSYRFVKQDLIVRLLSQPSAALIDELNRDFQDILTGPIKETRPLTDESDDPENLHYPRLLVPFDRRDFARLREMIDVINRQS
jgi:hypothetical protein